ncbi:hypothetical protein NDU88_003712 [Pleurodeles waltl]|uniref:Uncharacterized protein n=1 Tax=Pleurodeles waltl TaxID=8319 RepID=A0AAV7TQJ3_PLEWA|nr:hypothetical protein NDU88_003712 [Pleurodeles waltl]
MVSDHSSVLLSLDWHRECPCIPDWHLHVETLEDPAFRQSVGEAIRDYFADNVANTTSPPIEWYASKAVIKGRCIAEIVAVWRTLVEEVETQERAVRDLELASPGNAELKQ